MNKVIVIGRIGNDLELKGEEGKEVLNLNLATNETYVNKETGEKSKKTDWHRLVAFGNRAKTMARVFKKGEKACFEGKLQYSSYDKEGQTHHTTQIKIKSFEFV